MGFWVLGLSRVLGQNVLVCLDFEFGNCFFFKKRELKLKAELSLSVGCRVEMKCWNSRMFCKLKSQNYLSTCFEAKQTV